MASVALIEIGSLTAVSANESQFIGSSSGIFFVNTVRRAFAVSKVGSPEAQLDNGGPSAESYIGGVDDEHPQQVGPFQTSNNSIAHSQPRTHAVGTHSIGRVPNRQHATQLIQVYFRVWHPLFPFLHGPTFLNDVETHYAERQHGQRSHSKESTKSPLDQCRTLTIQCIFNIAALDRPDLRLGPQHIIPSVANLTAQLCSLATRHDIPVLQALLAGQLYLIAIMSLHSASVISGILLRLIFRGGFHRCPCRYSQLSSHDTDIRKRIFWSAYVADRYLSQALGLPLGVQDSDIDVCVPGSVELHRPLPQVNPSANRRATADGSSRPSDVCSTPSQSSSEGSTASRLSSPHLRASVASHNERRGASHVRRPGEQALTYYVAYGQLTGRALEMLHKSIRVRKVRYNQVLELTSEIHSFWHSLPRQLQDLPSSRDSIIGDDGAVLGLFFTLIYQQLVLLVNRPFLSLDTASLEFKLSLQACISSSRTVISTLMEETSGYHHVYWPGTLSVTWMSGLILAFACALNLYPMEKGFPEVEACLSLLEGMSHGSATAKHCHSALAVLLKDLSASRHGEDLDDTGRPYSKRRSSFSQDGRPSRNAHLPTVDRSSWKRQRRGNPAGADAIPPQSENEDSHLANSVPGGQKKKTIVDSDSSSASPADMTPTLQPSSHHNENGSERGNSTATPFWQLQPDTGVDNFDLDPAYAHDIFGSLSFESLFQYDETLQNGLWNDVEFPGF